MDRRTLLTGALVLPNFAAGEEATPHVFERGGHGFDLRAPAGLSAVTRPNRLLTWLDALDGAKAG